MFGLFKSGKMSVPHWKNTTMSTTKEMPVPDRVYLALSQHIGAPCAPVVAVGDAVKVGQVIASTDAFVSAPIHASVSGVVEAIDDKQIVIKSDGKQELFEEITAPDVSTDEAFVEAIKTSGLVGLGGAGFPTFIKYGVKDKSTIDTLIINAAECEPFITSDAREIIEETEAVLKGALAVAKHLDVSRIFIGIEAHNQEAIATLNKVISANDVYKNVRLKILPAMYPQGAEKVLIMSTTDRELPLGKLPSDVGVVVSNVSSIGFVGRYLETGIPLVSRRVTVDGGAISEPSNVLAPIGTPIADFVAFTGGYKTPPAKIISGGPMMGMAVASDDVPTTKRTGAITIFNTLQAIEHEEKACIRCARCIDACPMNLLPTTIDEHVRLADVETLQTLDLMACIDCGLCSYVCPSNRTLVQNIRVGKGMLKEAADKKKAGGAA